ncbi:cation:proton antiporter [Sandaracinus amylolyticus]|uniref:Trk system potassium uptake protein TrkA n=1 Tax=Sandaracinus amylolyticus TaxID=927083 RepID=A0A0F6YF03_9BACT|nr:cation:proton antiporter [Sandaracinus amylolyticus]AKF03016.1 Trk system potassium uptake protein TrkA [Sandaracinus amylolyticus]
MRTFVHALLAVAVCGLMEAARRTAAPGDPRASGSAILLGVGFVLIVSWALSRIVEQLRLPKLTGYMAAGITAGPFVLGYLDHEVVRGLSQVNGVAVALIALTAGSEINVRAMRSLMRSIGWISFVAVIGTAVVLSLVAYAISPELPFFEGVPEHERMALAAVIGIVVASGSPAVVVAIRAETRADGPTARTVLGVVVIADLIVILLFAIASSVARAIALGDADQDTTLRALAWELFGSMTIGLVTGVLLAVGMRLLKRSGGAGMFAMTTCLVAAEVGRRIHLDPLLLMLTAGMFVENVAGEGEELRHTYEDASLPVFVLFFTVVGASIRLDVLPVVVVPAAILVGVRAAGLLGGTRIAARLADAPTAVEKWAGFGLLPQAGLANALAILVARTFPGYGDGMSALLLGIVALNAVLTPALFRLALVRSGEAFPDEPEPALA